MMLSLLISDGCAVLYDKNEARRFDESEKQELSAHLMSYGQAKVRLFTDSIEESHLTERTPKMSSFDASALQKRLLKKHFKRSTRAFSALDKNQYDSVNKNKQSKHLLAGFTDPKHVNEWVLAVQRSRCLLVGVHSLPLSLPLLFEDLHIDTRFSLVVYKNDNNIYRHAFFDDKHLEFSRVIQHTMGDVDDVSADLKETLTFIQERTKGARIGLHFIDGANISGKLVDKIDSETIKALNVDEIEIHEHQFNTADQFILDRLRAERKLVNHYATEQELSGLNTAIVKSFLKGLSVAVLMLGVGASLIFFYQERVSSKKRHSLETQTKFFMRQYDEKNSARKHQDIDPRQIAKGVQQIECMQSKEFRSPKYALMQISGLLVKYDAVLPVSMVWKNNKDDLSDCINPANEKTKPKANETDGGFAKFELIINAKILSPDLTPRQINDLVDNMAKDISEQPWVMDVSILSTPYSFESDRSITMTGDAKATENAQFSIQVMGR